jgi:Flp pilus assembly pilin Flp
MKNLVSSFLHDEDGAITVDFVVLTAAICTLGLIILLSITGETVRLGNDISDFMDNVEI